MTDRNRVLDPSDPWVYPDCCQRKVRNSTVVKDWQGFVVCKEHYLHRPSWFDPPPIIKGELTPVPLARYEITDRTVSPGDVDPTEL